MARILVVEDDAVTQKIVSTLLEKSGHEVECCDDGLEGLYSLKHDGSFDMVIADIRMPYIDGRMLVKAMRQNSELKTVPILLMSGVVGPKCIDELCQDGVTAFIAKPIKSDEVLEYVNRYVN
ncbi:hypothetical protein BVX99_02610 [bacterium F16]|nr:hypothetical protein BVX99_02610 [bacterium F16]